MMNKRENGKIGSLVFSSLRKEKGREDKIKYGEKKT